MKLEFQRSDSAISIVAGHSMGHSDVLSGTKMP